MNKSIKAGQWIVSKSEYARELGSQVVLGLYGCWAIFLSMLSGLAALACVYIMVMTFLSAVNEYKSNDLITAVLTFAFTIGLSTASVYTWRVGFIQVRKAWKTDVVPLTCANTAALSAPDSLVRASQEPLQAQEAVLLRVLADMQDKREEQLLRAATIE